jgi:hypothetical protein
MCAGRPFLCLLPASKGKNTKLAEIRTCNLFLGSFIYHQPSHVYWTHIFPREVEWVYIWTGAAKQRALAMCSILSWADLPCSSRALGRIFPTGEWIDSEVLFPESCPFDSRSSTFALWYFLLSDSYLLSRHILLSFPPWLYTFPYNNLLSTSRNLRPRISQEPWQELPFLSSALHVTGFHSTCAVPGSNISGT